MAAALRRSDVSFRSQGSSGVVWSGMFYSGELNRVATTTTEYKGEITEVEPSATADHGAHRPADDVPPSSFEPRSPKLSGCGLCRVFGKPVTSKKTQKKTKPA